MYRVYNQAGRENVTVPQDLVCETCNSVYKATYGFSSTFPEYESGTIKFKWDMTRMAEEHERNNSVCKNT